MEIKELEESIVNKNNQNEKRRDILISNVLDLSINSGKINGNANYILYSENSKKSKKEKIKETEQILYQVIKNVVNIANSLELSIEEICDKKNK